MISLISTLKSILQEIRISCVHLETFISVSSACFKQEIKDMDSPFYFWFFSYWHKDGDTDVGKRCFIEMCSLSSSTKTPRCPGEHNENSIFSIVVFLLKNMAAPQHLCGRMFPHPCYDLSNKSSNVATSFELNLKPTKIL